MSNDKQNIAEEIKQTDNKSLSAVDLQVKKKITTIPSYAKCARCKKDLRKEIKKGGCDCNSSHPLATSKSGNAFWATVIREKGGNFSY